MLLTFLAAKKDKLVNSFLIVLVALIFWTGGSVFMRLELWPIINSGFRYLFAEFCCCLMLITGLLMFFREFGNSGLEKSILWL